MALRYVDRWPLVPVVNRADFRKLEGVVSEHDVLSRYRDFGRDEKEAMHGQFTWQMPAILAGLKIVATLLSFVGLTPLACLLPRCSSARCWGRR